MKRIFILIFVSLLAVSCLKEELHTVSVPDSLRFSTQVSSFLDTPTKASGIRALPLEGESSLALVSVETSAGDINPETKSVPVTSLEDDFFASGFWYEGSWDGTQTPNLFHRKEISRLEPDVWVTTSVVAPQWPGTGKVRFYAVSPSSRQGLTYKSLSTDGGAPVIAFQVEQDVTAQVDLLESVSSDYAGDFNDVVPLSFTHALTAVRVSCEDLGREAYVRSVTLSGVYSYGKHVVGSSVWTEQKNVASYVLYPDVDLTGAGEEQIIAGKNTMLLMPQTLPAGATLTVVLRMDGHDFTLKADLSGTAWQPGYLVDYRVEFANSGVVMCRMEIRDVEPVGSDVEAGVEQKVAEVESAGLTFSGEWVDIPWEVKGFSEDGTSWSTVAPAWLSTYTDDGDGDSNAFLVSTAEVDEEKRIYVKLGQTTGSVVKVFEVVKELGSNDLTFTVLEDGTIEWGYWYNKGTDDFVKTIYYSLNDGAWTPLTPDIGNPASLDVDAGDVVKFRADNDGYGGSYDVGDDWYEYIHYFYFENAIAVSGSVMSLIGGDDASLTSNCFWELFYGCTGLTTAPELPATTLASACYSSMFSGCTGLTSAPELPATTLAQSCYSDMFSGCTGLTSAPVLPATTLESGCYSRMFSDCTGLTSAPELLATTLAEGCYYYMFSDCSNLNYVKCLATDISASDCVTYWLSNVNSTGTFVKASGMATWFTGISGIPSGWTVVDAS